MAFRTPKPSPNAAWKYPVWKVKPPGPEQIELEKMFAQKEIDACATADIVHKSKELFKKFSSSVFGAHFRTTKAKFGLAACVPSADGSCKIPELGGSTGVLQQSQSLAPRVINEEDEVEPWFPVTFFNPPHSTWIYSDLNEKIDYVCVAVPIFSGSKNVKFTLSEDGMKVTIHFTWPEAVYKPAVLFHEKIQQKTLTLTHPMVHAFGSQMIREGRTVNSSPAGQITIELPQQVKREPSTWKFESIKQADSCVCLIRFNAYQNELFVEEADTSFNF